LGFLEEFDLVVSFACLHWVKDHLPVLKGIRRSLLPGGRVLLQFGGRGNAAALLAITEELTKSRRWSGYFRGFQFPYHFYGPEEYRIWLAQAGLRIIRLELVEKDMVHQGKPGLEGIIRVTWLPYLERLPESSRQDFVEEVARRYLERFPLDAEGRSHVRMMRLEVEACRPKG
jgi:trans-aconitate methyltransferase